MWAGTRAALVIFWTLLQGCRAPVQTPEPRPPAGATEAGAVEVPTRWPSPEALRGFVPRLPDDTAEPSLTLTWSAGLMSNVGFALDRCAFARRPAEDPYCGYLGVPGDADAERAVSVYREVFERWIEAREQVPPEPQLVIDLLPPAQVFDEERLLEAFFESDDVAQVCARLELSVDDCGPLTEAARTAAEAIEPRVVALGPTAAAFAERAQVLRITSFVDQAVRFFGVQGRVPQDLEVQVLVGTDTGTRATVIGRHMVLPVPPGDVPEAELLGLIDVTVHELGHAFAGAVDGPTRQKINEAILARSGLVQSRHHNIFDEATQTALGNVLFANWAHPEHVDHRQSLYNYEPDNDVPWAIDGYARALVPALAAHFHEPGGFAEGYLDEALEIHGSLFDAAPRHFARVAVVVQSDPMVGRVFGPLFHAFSRYAFARTDIGKAAARLATAPMIPRWLLLVGDDLAPTDDLIEVFGEVELAREEACLRADPPNDHRGWRFVAQAHDLDSLRVLLTAAQTADRIVPLLCVRTAAE